MVPQPTDLRIITIDDNPEIHRDFIKILTTDKTSKQFNELDTALFGNQGGSAVNISLPVFQIDTATQGQEGVERIKKALEEGNPYCLAFVDIRMPPGWDGIETIKHIWELDPDIQIVICTAYSDYTWEETVNQLGMHDNLLILKKPFDNVAVRQLACALAKKWQLLQETKSHMAFLEQRIKERTSSLEESLSLRRSTLESSADGILVLDNAGSIIDSNPAFVDMWRIPKSALETKNNKILLEYMLNQLKKPSEFMRMTKDTYESKAVSIDIIRFNDDRVFECYSQPYKVNEKIIGHVWSFRDVTHRVYLEKKLEHQATHDILTDLPNRALLSDRLKQAIARAERTGNIFAVLYFDLDRFKLVNDSLSHESGDELLKDVAKRLKKIIRSGDTLARIGGDEFVMVIPDLHREEEVIPLATKSLEIMREPFVIANHEFNTTTSIGICFYPKDAKSIDDLLRSADLAMYSAKESGANQYKFYSGELNKRSLERLETENELRRALENNEFTLYYQPQIDVFKKQLIAVEALIRWNHPTKGIIPPLDFIPIAEETGLIIPIGEWILKTACAQNKEWQNLGFPPIRTAVNITSQQLRQPNFTEKVINILKETKLEPTYLEIELTENTLVSNASILQVILNLKKAGVHVALDDFGSGNSSLNYIKKIPLDRLKIDQTFIHNISKNKNDEILIQAIISMAKTLDLEVVAEGVETKQQLHFLELKHIDDVQGHYISKPLSANEFEKMLKTLTLTSNPIRKTKKK